MAVLKRLATGIVALSGVLCADANDTLRTQAMEDVVVTTERSRTSNIYSTIPVQSISGDDIRLTGIQSLADAVKRFAGTTVKDYGGIGGMKTVSVRNLGAQHTAVSYDGIVVSNTQAGQTDIGRFSLDNVSMLSIAIGQGSDMLQSARHYASAAMMSITTEQPLPGSKPSLWRVGLSGGSWGQISPKLRLWQRLSNSSVLSVNAEYMRADGVYPYTLTNGMESTREKRNNSGINQWHAEGNMSTLFSDSSKLDIKAYYYRSSRGLPGAVILYNNQSKEHLWDENLFAQAIYKKRWSNLWQMAVRAKYTHSWNRYEDYNIKYTNGRKEELNKQDEYYASSTLHWKPLNGFSLSLAEDVAFNKLHTNVNGSPNPLRFTSLTALAARLRVGRLTAEGNLVMTYATESLTESEKYSLKTPEDRKHLSPSLSFSWRILPEEALYIRALYKSTFRMPTFNDLYYLQIGNTSLRPEKAHEYGIGLTWNSRRMGCIGYIALTADGYYNDVTDKIVAFPSTYIWKMANFGKAEIWGIDATLASQIDLARKTSAVLSASLSWQDAQDKTPGSATYGSQLPYTAKVSGGISAMLNTPWFCIGYSASGQGKRYSMAQNIREYRLKPYMEHTISLSHEFACGSTSRLRMQLSVNNLTDEQYEIIKYYPMPGRSVTASATMDF
ncbi:MAG: TonB-dependent receptor plug domain-containing protein [Prevotella sp.]